MNESETHPLTKLLKEVEKKYQIPSEKAKKILIAILSKLKIKV
ncbi:hypothetical protein [Caproiciproducens sp. CPB-2]|nr:hypothetical protein [Caproiciproducens sp. CPB-2]MDF1495815.1 hypothetical protein [Caproiciproducens sp. CPB-2]